jgi:hypothetical protein
MQDLLSHAEDKYPELIRSAYTIDKKHGRLEEREIFVLATHNTALQFQGVKQIARLHRKREVLKTGKVYEEKIFLITNMDHICLDVQRFMHLKRDYWQIENKLHYRKDLVFGEDRSTIRIGHGPENMSALRNFAVSLLMANNIDNVKRCVENFQYGLASQFHQALL